MKKMKENTPEYLKQAVSRRTFPVVSYNCTLTYDVILCFYVFRGTAL